MEGRKRTVQVKFYVTEEERRLIREKMKLIPTRNMAAYLRKMAIDGYKRQLDFKHSYPSGCDTSKLLSDDLENELYYDGF